MANDNARTPIEELREAAKRLRQYGVAATLGDWAGFASSDNDDGRALIFGGPVENGYRTSTVFQFCDYMDCEECTRPSPEDLAWMTLAHPGLAEPLAVMLDTIRELCDGLDREPAPNTWQGMGLAVARQITGGEPGA